MVTDLAMPGKNGIDTIRTVRRQHSTVKTIARSGAFCGHGIRNQPRKWIRSPVRVTPQQTYNTR